MLDREKVPGIEVCPTKIKNFSQKIKNVSQTTAVSKNRATSVSPKKKLKVEKSEFGLLTRHSKVTLSKIRVSPMNDLKSEEIKLEPEEGSDSEFRPEISLDGR